MLFGFNPEYYVPGSYIQYVRFKGNKLSGDILNEKKFSGNLIEVLRKVDTFIDNAIVQQRPVATSTLHEKTSKNYPNWALRELITNAVMHRDYESNAPIKFYHFDDNIQISNAGGLYGKASPENFPNENDYRNPVLAEAMKVLGYVNRFNRGIARVKTELEENGNPDALFDFKNISSFTVNVFSSQDGIAKKKTPKDSSEEAYIKFGISSEEIRNKFGRTAMDIINVIIKNPEATAKEIAENIDLTDRTVEKNIAKLKSASIIKRIGSNKKGSWHIIEQK